MLGTQKKEEIDSLAHTRWNCKYHIVFAPKYRRQAIYGQIRTDMEGFWGILKRERYYGRRFTSKRELVQMIETYIHYYNTRRVQRNLGVLTPMEKHELGLAA